MPSIKMSPGKQQLHKPFKIKGTLPSLGIPLQKFTLFLKSQT